ncbi:MAG: AI-2E family transporter [Anaerolineae bacterium]|nr:AI-2E family transporter [Anaerolineae bacterium]
MSNWSRSFRYLVGLFLLAALVGFVYYAREAIQPLIVSAFIAYLINPAAVFLAERTRLSRRAAVTIVYFTAILLLFAVPATVTPFFLDELTGVGQDLFDLLSQFQAALAEPLIFMGMSLDLSEVGRALGGLESLLITPLPEDAFWILESTSRGTIWFLVIIVTVYLLLVYWPNLRDSLIGLAPATAQGEARELYRQLRGVWMAYLRGQLLLMLVVGVVFAIAWTILGIPGAFVLGVIAGLFTLVPDIGPILAVALAMGVALLEGSSWIPLSNAWVTVIVFLVYFVLINLKNMWLRPVIMGRSVHMNEGLIFVVILMATILNGILGALLAVPVLASSLIIYNYLLRKVLGQQPFDQESPFVRRIRRTDETSSTRPARRLIKKQNRN